MLTGIIKKYSCDKAPRVLLGMEPLLLTLSGIRIPASRNAQTSPEGSDLLCAHTGQSRVC